MDFCEAMIFTGIAPDFILVDEGEGATGAVPVAFSNSMGMPMQKDLIFVHDTLVGFGLRQQKKVIAAGKIITGFGMARATGLGIDGCYSARYDVGSIQDLKCNTNNCLVGIANEHKSLMKGLGVADKATRV
ncbi:glutamate synthase-related protein [Maribacter antarcticus]|uniref:glutamate synthase-related protein n=1 Tax=Maribacter antarcticus TaxID=505250 RepID=UPI00047B51A4|nr:glutamate synthase-related protein [Maribacter antarcticus]